jgi:hypothetical protein
MGFESRAMSSHNNLRLDENQRLLPPGPDPPQDRPEQPISSSNSWLRTSLSQDGKLLPKREIFQK